MRKVTRIALAATALVVLLPGCERAGRADDAQMELTDTAAVEQQIRDIEKQWMGEYNSRNVDALAAHYSDEAALANPGVALATDATSRRASLAEFVSDPTLKIQFEADRVMVAKSGDLAYSRGQYTMQTIDPATKNPKTQTGTYLTVWRKEGDGSWKSVEDAVIPGVPEAAPTG